MDRARELLYKSFELEPLAKHAVEAGKDATKSILNRLEYLASLTIPRDLTWLGIDHQIAPMDSTTYYYIRDSPVFSTVRRIADHGIAHQYGKVLLEGGNAPESLIGAASAIALVQENELGDIQIHRKKQLNLEDKHGKDLIPKFFNVKDKTGVTSSIEEVGDEKLDMILKTEEKPPLKNDYTVTPPLKDSRRRDDDVPWN